MVVTRRAALPNKPLQRTWRRCADIARGRIAECEVSSDAVQGCATPLNADPLGGRGRVVTRLAPLSVGCLVILLGGCAVAPDAHFDTTDGWHDLVIPITSYSVQPSGVHEIIALGEMSDRQVGLRLLIEPTIRPGILDGEIDSSAFVREGITLVSIGMPTQHLVEVLAGAYEVPHTPGQLRSSLRFTVFALQGDPRELATQHVNFKAFHDDVDEHGEYYELYIHVDIPEARVAIREKDTEYRSAVIQTFFD